MGALSRLGKGRINRKTRCSINVDKPEAEMESKNRNVWIILIVVLVKACCCVLATVAGAAWWFAARVAETGYQSLDLDGLYREGVEETFAVGDAPSLEIANFAGSVTIRSGEAGIVRVVATEKASSRTRLDRIELSMSGGEDRVVVRAEDEVPSSRGNASVDLEITAPTGSRLDLDLGAGPVEVRDITGRIDVNNGAGTVEVQGARGTACVEVGAGQITYHGMPGGDCRFETGVGEIILHLPADLNMAIDASTGLGAVNVGFAVDGTVSESSVRGLIGDGSQGSIYVHTGIGAITLDRR
jgi:hypothetical protein